MSNRDYAPDDRAPGTQSPTDDRQDVTWESVLVNEGHGKPAVLDEIELVDVTTPTPAATQPEGAFFGFEDTVSVSDRSFPGAGYPATAVNDAAPSRTSVPLAGVIADEEVFEVEPLDDEPTQVLRRSLLSPSTAYSGPGPLESAGIDHGASAPAPPPAAATQTAYLPPVAPAAVPAPAAPSFEDAMDFSAATVSVDDTVRPEVPSRALPRILALILTLLFTPITWYLVADSAARLAFADNNPMLSGVVNIAAIGELAAGIIGIAILAIVAAQSSLGLIVTGVITAAVGIPFLVVPAMVTSTGYWGFSALAEFNTFGANITNHFMATGYTGMFVVLGTLMIAFGWVIGHVRRVGRAEEAQRAIVAKTNPGGLGARWARTATQKSSEL